MPGIGFVLLTHNEPAQALRLARRLARSFERAPIACHHDFSQTPLDVRQFPPHVQFVRPHVRTHWGDFSLVDATLAALRLLYDAGNGPDWVVLLSGADYPLHSAARVLHDLERAGAHAYMRRRIVDPFNLGKDHGPPGPLGYDVGEGPINARRCFRRYYRQMLRISLPWPGGRMRTFQVRTARRWLVTRLAPYNERFRCYAGPQWFTLGRAAAEYVLQWHDRNPWFADYLRIRIVPDESYFQTILANAPQFRVSNENYRYIDWRSGSRNPRTLGAEDLSAMLDSPAHFARKFAPDDPVLDRLDELLDSGVV
jgi:hypothetical protein